MASSVRRAVYAALRINNAIRPATMRNVGRTAACGIQRSTPMVYRKAFVRWQSAPSAPLSSIKAYEFARIKELCESSAGKTLLIDVREPKEYHAGYIPTAVNIPIQSSPDALFLPGPEFEERFQRAKPAPDQEIVFYCKSGVRSHAAARLALQAGYTNVAEYQGSWLDWTKQGGEQHPKR